MIAVVGSIVLSCAAAWLLALIDLRLGSGIGCAVSVALVTTLQGSRRIRAAASGAIAGVLAAYLVHLAHQIVGPAWPEALLYAKSTLIAPAITFGFGVLSVYDAINRAPPGVSAP